MKNLNYPNSLDRKVHIIRVQLFDGTVYEGEIIGRNYLGYQLKIERKCNTPEYVVVNEAAIKSLEDLGFL